jgi:hypothetical protein
VADLDDVVIELKKITEKLEYIGAGLTDLVNQNLPDIRDSIDSLQNELNTEKAYNFSAELFNRLEKLEK